MCLYESSHEMYGQNFSLNIMNACYCNINKMETDGANLACNTANSRNMLFCYLNETVTLSLVYKNNSRSMYNVEWICSCVIKINGINGFHCYLCKALEQSTFSESTDPLEEVFVCFFKKKIAVHHFGLHDIVFREIVNQRYETYFFQIWNSLIL